MKRAIFLTATVGFLVGVALVGFPKIGSVLKSKALGSGSSARTIYVKNASGHWPFNPYGLISTPGDGSKSHKLFRRRQRGSFR